MNTEKPNSESRAGNSSPQTGDPSWSPVPPPAKKYEYERQLQTDIFKEFGAMGKVLRIWRQNTGMAYGLSQVKSNMVFLRIGKFQQALQGFERMQPTRYGVEGMPDIFGILAIGRMLAIELKMEGKDLSDMQEAWRAMFERMGGLYIVARSVQDVYAGLRKAGVAV